MRKLVFTAALLLLALAVCAGPAAAEKVPATPTDLACAHEHTGTVIYFFDSPVYTSLSAVSHRVTGPGVVATLCRDCGATVSEEMVDNAEEVRPHTIKKGVCVLCGYRQKKTSSTQEWRDVPGERTLEAQPDDSGLLFLTLTEQDLIALENANVEILLVRGEHGKAVVAADVKKLREMVSREAAPFSIEIADREDGSLFAALSLGKASEREDEPEIEGVNLRFYEAQEPPLMIALAPTDGDELTETPGVWDENGYWVVPYVSEGDYLVVR